MDEPRTRAQVIPRHIPALDGLRAFAILAVLVHHCGEYYLIQNSPQTSLLRSFVENLGSGVDLFFALSGFLITGILLDSLDRPYFFRRFYWRRGLRIWPLYYTFLLAAYLVHRRVFSGIGVTPFVFYYRNFLGPDRASDMYVGQFWSLCVEEQFYLVWPLVLYFTAKRLRIPLIVFLMNSAFFCRAYLFWRGVDGYVIYRLPYCHMDVLLAGALVAVLTRHGMKEKILRTLCFAGMLLGIAGLAVVETVSPNVAIYPLGLTSTALLFGGVVGLCIRGVGRAVRTVLESPLLEAISKRSYAMYVFHLVPLYVSYKLLLRLKALPLGMLPALPIILGIGLVTYGMAWLSWRYLEEPMLRLKKWEWFATRQIPVSADTDSTE